MIEIAHFRNLLAIHKFGDNDLNELAKVYENLNGIEFAFAKVVRFGVGNAIHDLKNNNTESALTELQFVHNIPVNWDGYKKWYQESFYTIEIIGYIDMSSDYRRVKEYIKLLAEAENFAKEYTGL